MRARPLVFLSAAFLLACGPVDPEPPEGVTTVPMPGPYDDWLTVEDVQPDGGDVGRRPEIRLQFDTYLEEDRLLDYGVASLESGGLRISGRVEYEMAARTLVFRPLRDLVPDLTYRLVLRADYLRSVTGAPLGEVELPSFVSSDEDATTESAETPRIGWEQVDAILERKCRSCHADPQWGLNPLTRASLVGARSEQTDAVLVAPYDPGDSYLMHKILPDYPLRRFTIQPPPWSRADPLTTSERRAIEVWIRNGAA